MPPPRIRRPLLRLHAAVILTVLVWASASPAAGTGEQSRQGAEAEVATYKSTPATIQTFLLTLTLGSFAAEQAAPKESAAQPVCAMDSKPVKAGHDLRGADVSVL